jgi:hypothetical protein
VGVLKNAFGIVGGSSAPSAPASVHVRQPCGEAHALRHKPTRGSPTRALRPSVGADRSLHHALHRCLSSQRRIYQVDIEEGEVNFRVQGKLPKAKQRTTTKSGNAHACLLRRPSPQPHKSTMPARVATFRRSSLITSARILQARDRCLSAWRRADRSGLHAS